MSWLVDNATAIYVLLGVIAAGLVAFFWLDKRVKFLLYAVGVVGLIGLVWLLTRYFDSDAKQLTNNVLAMRDAVVAGDVDDLFEHVSQDFRFKDLDRELTYAVVAKLINDHKINHVKISKFRIEALSRENGAARASFMVSGSAEGDFWYRTETDFVLEEGKWKLKTMRFYNPVVDQDREIDIPGLR